MEKADWKYKLKSFFIIIISPIKNDLIIGCPHWFTSALINLKIYLKLYQFQNLKIACHIFCYSIILNILKYCSVKC